MPRKLTWTEEQAILKLKEAAEYYYSTPKEFDKAINDIEKGRKEVRGDETIGELLGD